MHCLQLASFILCFYFSHGESRDLEREDLLKVMRQIVADENVNLRENFAGTIENLKQELASLTGQNSQLIQQVDELRSEIRQIPFVAFSVVADGEVYYEEGEIVRFPVVYTNVNEGGSPAWDPATSQFTVPIDGYYRFTATFFKFWNADSGRVTLMKRDSVGDLEIATVHNWVAAYLLNDVESTATMSVIIPCQAGDILQLVSVWGGWIIDNNVSHYNQFSGEMISEGL